MAYLVDITYRCDWSGCGLLAKKELRDRWNGVVGRYCRDHAGMAFRAKERDEASVEARSP